MTEKVSEPMRLRMASRASCNFNLRSSASRSGVLVIVHPREDQSVPASSTELPDTKHELSVIHRACSSRRHTLLTCVRKRAALATVGIAEFDWHSNSDRKLALRYVQLERREIVGRGLCFERLRADNHLHP